MDDSTCTTVIDGATITTRAITGARGVTVSVDGAWVPGLYDTHETAAHAAATFTDVQLVSLAAVWRADGQNRPATMNDLESIDRDAGR